MYEQFDSDSENNDNTNINSEYSHKHINVINSISNKIIDNEINCMYDTYIYLKTKIINCLINQILSNSPKSDITITKFPNIKT